MCISVNRPRQLGPAPVTMADPAVEEKMRELRATVDRIFQRIFQRPPNIPGEGHSFRKDEG